MVFFLESPDYMNSTLTCPPPPFPPLASSLSTSTKNPVCAGGYVRYSCNGLGTNGFQVLTKLG